jgi:hypothetical protein
VQAYPDAWIEIAYSDPATGDVDAAQTFSTFELKEAAEFAEKKNFAGCNVYVGPAIRQGKQPASGRASDKDAVTSSHAWAEFDGAGDAKRIGAIMKEQNLAPALVVTTGTVPHLRAHLYFKLDGAVTPENLKAVNTALYESLGSDAVHNNSRIMRLAGTVNYPTPKKAVKGYVPELVTLASHKEARTYSADDLIKLAPDASDSPYKEYGKKNGKQKGPNRRRTDRTPQSQQDRHQVVDKYAKRGRHYDRPRLVG